MDLKEVIEQFHDHVAPKLDCYEQAIYLYLFRHSRLLGQTEIVVGFKSARRRMAFGVGEHGKPMSESTCSKKLQSLEAKRCLKVLDSERSGTRIRLYLPSEIPGIILEVQSEATQSLEDTDFFAVSENRRLILAREGGKCFYCRRVLRDNDSNGDSNWVIEHVISRPDGDNSYRNVVAACLSCNNRKKDRPATEYLRELYRGGFINELELEQTLDSLQRLKKGELKPAVPVAENTRHR